MSITQLHEALTKEVRGDTYRDHRKLANNTYGRIEGNGTVIVKLHDTDIVKVTPTTATYDTGGWYTVTTKERINRWTPAEIRVSSKNGVWHISEYGGRWDGDDWVQTGRGVISRFWDGIALIDSDEGVVVQGGAQLDDPDAPLRKALNGYVALYTDERIAELVAGAVESGTGGDCWYCSMFEEAGIRTSDHLLSHIADSYTMATLALNAMKASGYRPDVYLGMFHPDHYRPGQGGMYGDTIRRAIRKYLKARVLNQGYTATDLQEAAA